MNFKMLQNYFINNLPLHTKYHLQHALINCGGSSWKEKKSGKMTDQTENPCPICTNAPFAEWCPIVYPKQLPWGLHNYGNYGGLYDQDQEKLSAK